MSLDTRPVTLFISPRHGDAPDSSRSEASEVDHRYNRVSRKPVASSNASPGYEQLREGGSISATSTTCASDTVRNEPPWDEKGFVCEDDGRGQEDGEAWNGNSYYELIPDVVNVVLLVLILALGCLLITLRGKPESEWNKRVVEISKILPTLWPIIFAAVLGSAIKAIAYWKAERGTELVTLEHLFGSQTFAGTLKTAFVFRALSTSTFALLLLWSLSPLGSQAFLRSAQLRQDSEKGSVPVAYIKTTPTAFSRAKDGVLATPFQLLFSTAVTSLDAGLQHTNGSGANFDALVERLGGAQKAAVSSAVDPWGNLLVPNLRLLPGYDAKKPNAWVSVDWRNSVVDHGSLIGIPFAGIPIGFVGNATIRSVSSEYHIFTCEEWKTFNMSTVNGVDVDQGWAEWMSKHYKNLIVGYKPELDRSPYLDAVIDLIPGSGNISEGFFVDTTLPNGADDSSKDPANRAIFGFMDGLLISVTICPVTTTRVEVEASCEGFGASNKLTCGVSAIREVGRTNYTLFKNKDAEAVAAFARDFPSILDSPRQGSGRMVALDFLLDPSSASTSPNPRLEMEVQRVVDVPMKVFQDRIGLLAETFVRAAMFPYASRGGPPGAVRLTKGSTVAATQPFGAEILEEEVAITTADMEAELPPVYSLADWWVAVYLMSTFVLLGSAILTLALRLRSNVPEVLSYPSGVCRDSVYFQGSGLDRNCVGVGGAISRPLMKIQVRIGNVRRDERQSRIAFAPVSMVSRIERKKTFI